MTAGKFNPAFAYVTTLFFMWGFVTSTIDPLVPSVRSVFSLSYAESMLTQFAFFLAYGIVSLPAAAVLARLGFPRAIILALGAMMFGCLLMPLATEGGHYWMVLAALFVIAAGITQLQVAANPLAALLGAPARSHFRLTLSQAVNSAGHVLAPVVASYIMLRGGVFGGGSSSGDDMRAATLRHVDWQFLMIAALIGLLVLFLWRVRARLNVQTAAPETTTASPLAALTSRWALFGALAVFLYVGAEVAIGSVMINFLHQPSVLAVDYDEAGRLLGLYWGSAMVGRALGSLVLIRIRAERLLAVAAAVALLLCLVVTQAGALTPGAIAGWAALAIGFFNSVMFPTIFTLTLERSTAPTASTSGLLCMAIVGGAVVPVLMGLAADQVGLALAFFIPLVAYACVVAFALLGPRSRNAATAVIASEP